MKREVEDLKAKVKLWVKTFQIESVLQLKNCGDCTRRMVHKGFLVSTTAGCGVPHNPAVPPSEGVKKGI